MALVGTDRIGLYWPPFFERHRFNPTMLCCVTVNKFHSNLDPPQENQSVILLSFLVCNRSKYMKGKIRKSTYNATCASISVHTLPTKSSITVWLKSYEYNRVQSDAPTGGSFTPKMAKNGSFQRPITSHLGGSWV